ncbi:hypothetical protein [Shouchella clausii]|uniref:hypothetical protein n=1 Tax=Shouchella clausii TaxID=79880 RepID=UPI000BA64728|nr:hypothetical protein [Shouchella clausii]PAD47830.1 hypothetical protein CHI09_04000 [Shouchella clausii]
MEQSRLIPRISPKGVFVFMMILFFGMLLLSIPLKYIHLSETMSAFLSAGISAAIGIGIVLTKIDGKTTVKRLNRQRIRIAIIVGFATSALMTFVFGGDLLG